MTTALDNVEPNDPTRAGTPLQAGMGARLSRNEIEQLCFKAARGASMSWGLAEEAAFAAVWLAARGLDGPGALLAQLHNAVGRPWNEICPVVAPGRFQAVDGGCLCPIALGASLCDHAALFEMTLDETVLGIGPVDHPVLLLGFLSDFARIQGQSVRLDWSGGSVLLGRDGGMSGDLAGLSKETRLEADLSIRDADLSEAVQQGDRLCIPAGTLQELNTYALRTTVPASDASRAGAGAATGDND